MKKLIKYGIIISINVILIVSFYIGNVSCYEHIDHDILDQSQFPDSYSLYINENEFNSNVNNIGNRVDYPGDYEHLDDVEDLGIDSDSIYIYVLYDDDPYDHYDATLISNTLKINRYSDSSSDLPHDYEIWLDARNSSGFSTWDNPVYEIELVSIVSEKTVQGTLNVHNAKLSREIEYTSPPEHLMLVLESVSDFQQESTVFLEEEQKYVTKIDNEVDFKRWKVTSVFANSADKLNDFEDAADDDDLKHFLDNRYTFYKATKFEVDAGKSLSEDEADFFTGVTPNSTNGGYKYFGTYGVKSGTEYPQLTLSVGAGAITESFSITKSDWKSMELYFENQKSTYLQKVKITIIPE